MRPAIVIAMLLGGCATETAHDGGVADGGEPDSGAYWERIGCVVYEGPAPMEGEVPFCPAVHDYLGSRVSRAVDAGPIEFCELRDGGEYCGPWDLAYAVRHTCETWITCPRARIDDCFHCATWDEDPGVPELPRR